MAEQWVAPLCDDTKGIHNNVLKLKTFVGIKKNQKKLLQSQGHSHISNTLSRRQIGCRKLYTI